MGYDNLVGQLFSKNGVTYMIVKHQDATVVAACRAGATVRRVIVPLAEVLASLDVDEIELTDVIETDPAANDTVEADAVAVGAVKLDAVKRSASEAVRARG